MSTKPSPVHDVARTWKRTRRGTRTRLNDYRLLGEACNRLLDQATHGQKRTRTAKAIKLIQQGEPLSWSYVQGTLYKSRRFALACQDLGVLVQMQQANLGWRQVTELLPLIRPVRQLQDTVDLKARSAGIAKLRQLLKQAARQRNPLTAAEVVQQMKRWSRQHSAHLGEAKAAYRDRVSIRKLLRALESSQTGWKQLRRSVAPSDWRQLDSQYSASVDQARDVLRRLQRLINQGR